MSSAYCKKDCLTCSWKEQLNCPGCKNGPGSNSAGSCDIAECCRAEGCSYCTNCSKAGTCELFSVCEEMPEMRGNAREPGEREVSEYTLQKVKSMSIWTNILFIVSLISAVGSIVSTLIELAYPSFAILSTAIDTVLLIIIIVAFFALGKYEDKFKHAAILNIVSVAIAFVYLFFNKGIMSLVIFLVMLVITLWYISCEANGYASILRDIDIYLSAKWDKYLKLVFRTIIALVITSVTAVIALIIPPFIILWLIVILAITLFFLVLAIVKLCYMYQTVSALKRFYLRNR